MKLKGKIAPWFRALFVVGNGSLLWGMAASEGGEAGGVLFALVLFNLVFAPILLRNYVLLEEERLTIVFGFMKDSMRISEIEQVYVTRNPIAGSAASLDRIVVKGKRQEMMCAVEDKEAFFDALKKRNAGIAFRR